MVILGSGAEREVDNIFLTRYACYLVAQNGDSRKQEIAFAQNYFAIQTRRAELVEQRLIEYERVQARTKLAETEKLLSGVLYERGVDNQGFAIIRSKGDKALFHMDTKMLKRKLGVPDSRPLADFLPTISIKAKDFAAEMTSVNVQQKDLYGQTAIENEHVDNNVAVRDMLVGRGIFPEQIPANEDIAARRSARSCGAALLCTMHSDENSFEQNIISEGIFERFIQLANDRTCRVYDGSLCLIYEGKLQSAEEMV